MRGQNQQVSIEGWNYVRTLGNSTPSAAGTAVLYNTLQGYRVVKHYHHGLPWEREARILQELGNNLLTSQFVVTCYGVVPPDKQGSAAATLLQGKTGIVLEALVKEEGWLPLTGFLKKPGVALANALDRISGFAEGLTNIHNAGYVQGDLNLSDVFSHEKRSVTKIIDFSHSFGRNESGTNFEEGMRLERGKSYWVLESVFAALKEGIVDYLASNIWREYYQNDPNHDPARRPRGKISSLPDDVVAILEEIIYVPPSNYSVPGNLIAEVSEASSRIRELIPQLNRRLDARALPRIL